ncbi:MAG: hypothetical protein WAT79_11140 [Saprospiraceae bacterium]
MIEILVTLIIGCFGYLITHYYSKHSKELAHDQMMKELFKDFNARYDKLNNNLIRLEKDKLILEKLKECKEFDVYHQTIIDFFNLCAEEFYWYHHKHRVDPIVWNSWNKGMNYWFNNIPAIQELWDIEIKNDGKISYYIIDQNEFFKKSTT